ncbi:Two-component system, response regulator of the LuxR family [Saccharothrix espanaensis DSM 44229]|uniref:Two-component system, response regulator of the LuxR family n=1 Tax=Saccharothrix espanaensis (strain ATCC 51144 / DSM 44229 / JCM 9112 / NBRC 15066 / NRRL 15764) TaxID=1179773 RepID=K0K6D2_SACES|nr:Two-component system, response regulator of the LuxR family [Saccharothrix espanaensis DSM 44229]
MIRVLVADDEDLVRIALASLLRLEIDLEVVALAADGESAVTAAVATRPDVAVVDAVMPGRDGYQVAADLARALPACAVVVLTGPGRPPHPRRALAVGAKGLVPKGSPAGALADVIRTVHGGGRYVDPAIAVHALLPPACPLTPQELEVLRQAEYDTPVTEVAHRMGLSVGTVRNYLSTVVGKLGATGRQDAFATAHDNGWL